MKKSRFTEEQVAYALRQAESGIAVAEVIRKLGVTEQTFYRWKRRPKSWCTYHTDRCWGSLAPTALQSGHEPRNQLRFTFDTARISER